MISSTFGGKLCAPRTVGSRLRARSRSAMAELTTGSRLDQYELGELLARSGMASIFKAKDLDNGRTVALKVPHLHLEGDIVFSERFRREQQIGERLDHPAIIKIYAPNGKRSRSYIAMELVEGRSLRALLK